MTDKNNDFSLMGGSHFINSIRSSGYKNTGYALGELIDNSIQAGASKIHILALTRRDIKSTRVTESIVGLAVVDNGCGMNPDLLRLSLLFGEGTNFGKKDSLGKFGVGLPQASLSQATIVEAWSWTDGFDKAYHTGFNINDKNWTSNGAVIPEPVRTDIPAPYSYYIDAASSKSGTIIKWSGLDRISWRKSSTLYSNVEFLIGRMYRYWINDGRVRITYHVLNENLEEVYQKEFRSVDPLYIMSGTSVTDCNPPVDPMFQEIPSKKFTVTIGDVSSDVTIRASYVRQEIKNLVNKVDQAGKQPYGQHANKNTGVSVVREDRELELISEWASSNSKSKDPRNRWWGVEVSFKSELDNFFGVTNDKQHANNLLSNWNKTFDDFKEDGETLEQVKQRLESEDIQTYMMMKLVEAISEMIAIVYEKSPAGKGNKKSKPGEKSTIVELEATKNTDRMKEIGRVGYSDGLEAEYSNEQKKKELVESLTSYGIPEEERDAIVKGYITSHNKYYFTKVSMANEEAFFIPRFDAGAIIIMLNTAHPMYSELFEVFDFMDEERKIPGKDIDDETQELLEGVYRSMKLILASWARMEDESIKNNKKGPISVRNSWGKMARYMNGDIPDENEDDF